RCVQFFAADRLHRRISTCNPRAASNFPGQLLEEEFFARIRSRCPLPGREDKSAQRVPACSQSQNQLRGHIYMQPKFASDNSACEHDERFGCRRKAYLALPQNTFGCILAACLLRKVWKLKERPHPQRALSLFRPWLCEHNLTAVKTRIPSDRF